MSRVKEIEEAVRGLSPAELAAFRAWFAEFEAERWDRQIEIDIDEERVDHFVEEALRNLREGGCTDL